ncbi:MULTISPECIES: TetR/AcrR family transcriptional regulator C-terminal domain-containing protein [Asticcacaulis]|uniref:TetR/AcrR family transcriptional regulator C-terminal domain-containing protein n=1 Tax=Asticcacaulis TaxID=76890 RepID=UPI001AE5A94B|nr:MULTISPECIES: TetR/AcrR family transcriptional regulator C-terminal domain-containing protein [Asticcacaulis]MBP2161354.1 TetR/AcrR family tetracycline transcriptional repressor [Asticcacaulis solisilvae]MDR6802399.1 TetR/AcrR family tetracycline transcriptional repressor [Asticcacaulis sp. BE141]
MKIDKTAIISAALDLLNEAGIDALSTRGLAQRLNVQQPALYWHFKNKQALLTAMNAVMLRLGHTHREPAPGQSWQTFIRDHATSFRKALLSFRDGARVHAGAHTEHEDIEQTDRTLRFMIGHGFSAADVMNLNIAVQRYVVGCVLEEQAESPSPEAAAALDAKVRPYPVAASALGHYRRRSPEQHFLDGLDLLICGFEARYHR